MSSMHDPNQNHLLAALLDVEYARLAPHLLNAFFFLKHIQDTVHLHPVARPFLGWQSVHGHEDCFFGIHNQASTRTRTWR